MALNEKELILKIRAGDKQAFAELVKAYQSRIFFASLRLMRNAEDAKEITQDAFVCAYQAIKGFRLRSSFYTWIYRIALNLCYHRLRSAQYKIKLKTSTLDKPLETKEGELLKNFSSSTPSPYQNLITKEEIELIQRALVSLKRKFYQVVVLHDIEGLSYKEIARIQRCSLGTVMSRLSRARKQLAKILKLQFTDDHRLEDAR
jgi:RNA polymerase sigma-70 factor (ECF subfamily)